MLVSLPPGRHLIGLGKVGLGWGRGLLAVERALTSEPGGLLTVLRLAATFGASRKSGAPLGLSFLI